MESSFNRLKSLLSRVIAREKAAPRQESYKDDVLDGSGVQNLSIFSDSPLTDPKNDLFGRSEFANGIADTLATGLASASLVVAINGDWGEGKTTVLNFIESALETEESVTTFRFNPWRFPSEPELLRNFFFGLAEAVGQRLPKFYETLGDFIKEKGAALAAIAGRPEAAREIGHLLSNTPLEELKDRLGELLSEADQTVVVLMDDIDRLDKSEIHAVFRLVKLTANIDQVSYILAYDEEMVAGALKDRYGNSPESGRRFIEKIVQVPLSLPPVDSEALRQLCFRGVDKALENAGVELSEQEEMAFVSGFHRGIECRLDTPRIAKRYSNMLLFSLPLIRGEVNHVEFLLVEAIRAFFPTSYENIRDNRASFVASHLGGYSLPNERERDREKELIDPTYNGLTSEEKRCLERLLFSLFPRLKTIYGNTIFATDIVKGWSEEKRVSSPDYVDRYFTFSVPTGDVPDRVVAAFMQDLANLEIEEIRGQIQQILSSWDEAKFTRKLYLHIERVSDQEAKKLGVALAMSASLFPNPESFLSADTPFARCAMIVAQLAEKVEPDGDARHDFLGSVVDSSDPISFAANVLRWLRTDESALEHPFTQEDKERAARRLIERLAQVSKDSNWLFEMPDEDGPLLAQIWSRYGDRQEVTDHVRRYLEEVDGSAHHLLTRYQTYSYPIDGSPPYKGDFRRPQYDQVASSFDPSILYRKLSESYGQELELDSYPRDVDDAPELRLARQFAWLFKNAQEEEG